MPVTLPGYEMGVQMCTFAYEGDQDQLQRMLTNGVEVNTAVSPMNLKTIASVCMLWRVSNHRCGTCCGCTRSCIDDIL